MEAPRLLKGKGSYTDDIQLPRMTHAVFLRSPYAHADIKQVIDTTDHAAGTNPYYQPGKGGPAESPF